LNSHYFGGLANHFSTQISQAMCGIATATMMLNALALPRHRIPEDVIYTPYNYFTSTSFFQNVTHMKFEDVSKPPGGVGIADMPHLLGTYVYNDWVLAQDLPAGIRSLRLLLTHHLSLQGRYMAVNYHRRAGIGQVGGGHWAPIGAYNPSKDMVLLMDPARYKYPPVWVPVENLYQSIMDVNECGLFTRTSDGSTLDWDMNKYWALFRGNESDADVKALRKEFNNFYACKEATRGLVVACLHLPCSMHP